MGELEIYFKKFGLRVYINGKNEIVIQSTYDSISTVNISSLFSSFLIEKNIADIFTRQHINKKYLKCLVISLNTSII